jgi:hypothetical protein
MRAWSFGTAECHLQQTMFLEVNPWGSIHCKKYLFEHRQPVLLVDFHITTIGILLSLTPIKKYEGRRIQSRGIFIYILVATIGVKMDLRQGS